MITMTNIGRCMSRAPSMSSPSIISPSIVIITIVEIAGAIMGGAKGMLIMTNGESIGSTNVIIVNIMTNMMID